MANMFEHFAQTVASAVSKGAPTPSGPAGQNSTPKASSGSSGGKTGVDALAGLAKNIASGLSKQIVPPGARKGGNGSAVSNAGNIVGGSSNKGSGGSGEQGGAVGNAGEVIKASDTKGRGNRSYLREATQEMQKANREAVTWDNFQSKLQHVSDQYNSYLGTFKDTFGERADLTEDDKRRLQQGGLGDQVYNASRYNGDLDEWNAYGERQEQQVKSQTAQLRAFIAANKGNINEEAAKEVLASLDQMDASAGELWRAAYNDKGLQARHTYNKTALQYHTAEDDYNQAMQELKDALQNTSSDQDVEAATQAARDKAKAAEDALRLARTAYEEAGGLGHSYSVEDRASDTIKGAVQGSAASGVDAFRALWEKGSGGRLEHDTQQFAKFDLDARTKETEYYRALQAAGGNENDPTVIEAKQRADEARAFADRYKSLSDADQALVGKAASKADQILGNSQLDIARAKEGASDLTKGLVDVGVAGTQMAMDAAVSAMTGLPSMAVLGIRSFGGGTQQARLAGADIDSQLKYGAAVASVEMMTEKMADGLAGVYGKGGADEIAEQVIGKLAKTDAGRTALRMVYGMLGEGAEEFVSSALDPTLRSLYNNKSIAENYSEEQISDWLYDALIGAALAIPGGGISIATGQNAQANAELRAADYQRMTGTGSVGNQVDAAWNVLTGKNTAEQQANIERFGREQLGMPDPLSQYVNNAQVAPEVQAARAAVKAALDGGKVNNTTAREILNNPELRAAAEYQTGISFEGMTTHEAQTALQNAARSGAYTTSQFQAQDERGRQVAEAKAEQERRAPYEYVGSVLTGKATVADANRILNDPALRDAWERLAGESAKNGRPGDRKKLPDNRKSAVKMILETQRKSISADAITSYLEERRAAETPVEAPEAPAVETAPEAPAVEQTPVAPAAEPVAEQPQAPVQEAPQAPPVEQAPQAPAQAPVVEQAGAEQAQGEAQTEQGTPPNNGWIPAADQTTAESTNGRGNERERGGATNARTNGNVAAELRQALANDPVMYNQLTNAEVMEKANAIMAKGLETAQKEVTEAVGMAKAGRKLSPEHFVAGFMVANQMARNGDVQASHALMADLFAEQTAAGQLGQLGRLIRKQAPEVKTMAVENIVGKMNQALTDNQRLKNIKNGVGNERGEITVNPVLMENFANAQTDAEQDAAIDAIKKDIARQIPATFAEKFTALRYLNMLGNFKTQGRNLVGNTAMGITAQTKYTIQSLMEAIASVGGYQRNTALFTNSNLRKAARADFEANLDEIKGQAKYADTGKQIYQGVNEYRKIFDFAPLEWMRKGTNWAMDAGDVVFMKPVYTRAFAGWLKAHGVTDASTATAEQIAEARKFAMREAQEATFHDDNKVSDFVSKFGRGENTPEAVRVLTEGIMPFRKTPANVAVRAVEYSPLGLAMTIANGVKGNGAEFINSLAKTATGSALFAAGMFLRAANKARASGDDEDKDLNYFRQMRGESDYSVKIGDKWVSLSQFAPNSIPFFMGVKMQELIEDGDGEWSMDDLGDILGIVSDPMLEMSMLSGVNDFFNDVSKMSGDTDALPSVVGNAALNYLSQGLTNTLLGQAEQAMEENRQTTYSDTRSRDATEFDQYIGSNMQKKLGKYSAKIPGWDYNQQDYVDAWGRTQSNGGLGARLFNAFINPTYITEDRSTKVDAELERLHTDNKDVEGFPSVLPQTKSRYTVLGNGVVMTPDEYQRFAQESGQMKLSLVSQFMDSPQYAMMSDAERAKTINDLYQFSDDTALQRVKSGYGISTKSDWDDERQRDNISEYLAARNVIQAKEPDYSHIDSILSNWRSLSKDTQTALKGLTGMKGLRFAYDELGMSSEEYNQVKSDITQYEKEGLSGETKAAADAAVIAKHFNGTDAEKIKALESQNLPDAQTGKRAAIVRRFEAAQTYDIPFNTWAKVEAYIQNAGSTSNKTLYAAADKYGIPAWQARWVYRKTSSDEDEVDLYNTYFSRDYVPKDKVDYEAYLGGTTPTTTTPGNGKTVSGTVKGSLGSALGRIGATLG